METRFTTAANETNLRLAIALVSALVLAIAMGCVTYSMSWQRGLNSLQKDAASRLKIFSSLILAPADKYRYLPKLVAESQAITSILMHPHDAGKIEQANFLLEKLNADAGATIIYVLNVDGLAIASSNWRDRQSLIGTSYAFRPYFFDALKKGSSQFYAMGITTHVPGYYISHVVKKDETILGVVVVKVNIHEIDADWKNNSHEMVVTDEKGIVFLSSQDDWNYRPMSELTALEKKELNDTRQYENVLKKPLPIEIEKILSAEERVVRLITKMDWFGNEGIRYFVRRHAVPSSEWKVYIFSSMEETQSNSISRALLAAGAVILLVLMVLYLYQFHARMKERQHSLVILEKAHQELSEKNGELRLLNEELYIKSVTDPLTGLSNRRLFMELAANLVSSAIRHHYPLSIIMIDIDHFKQINDTHGHDAGDKVLQAMATLLSEEMRDTDILARFGGEEFVIALPYSDEEATCAIAERIRKRVMNQAVDLNGGVLRFTISAGVAQHRARESTLDDTIKRADLALYNAKRRGRNIALADV
jgi:two-component system C4-dicarboxylate transport sensor histidine kinase DctB